MIFKGKLEKCEIVCVGTELLMGSTLNTNANTIAKVLAQNGLYCFWQTVVGDNIDRLTDQVKESITRSDLIIFTGGLGPTEDDLTMKTVCDFCGVKQVFDKKSFDRMTEMFKASTRPMTDNNLKQAMLPENSIILDNDNGTAPGALFQAQIDEHYCLVALLPGPPSEMGLMLENYLIPALKPFIPHKLKSEYVHIIGVGESKAETMISDMIDGQVNPSIAPYASEGECMFRVTQSMPADTEADDLITPIVNRMKDIFGDHIYEIGTRSLSEVVVDLLKERGLTCAYAESLTGGMISSGIVDVPGSSKVFEGSIICYSNEVKQRLLGVPREVIVTKGAVSEECARQMAKGVRELIGSNIAVSVTGIAGPDGGSIEKPVGTVFIGFSGENGEDVIELHLNGNRTRIRKVTALRAYDLIRMHLLKGSYYNEKP